MEPAVIPVWKLSTVYARMFAVTAILSSVIKIRGLFKSTEWRHFQNVKFEALSARRVHACNKQPDYKVSFLLKKSMVARLERGCKL